MKNIRRTIYALLMVLLLTSPLLAACPGGNDYCMFYKNVFTGGGDNALDGIPAATPPNLSSAVVVTATGNYHYTYDTTSAATENSPWIIAPDDATDERWLWVAPPLKTPIKSTAANYTIGTTDARECYGGVIYVTSAATVTQCDNLAEGMSNTVITIGGTAVSVDMQADDKMNLDGVVLNDGDKATNTSTAGDILVCVYYDVTGMYCASGSPDGDNWTDGGP